MRSKQCRAKSGLVAGLLLLLPHTLLATSITASDTIRANVTWSADTVRVTGDVIAANGVTLTISPGVLVEFQGHFRLAVQGRLLAQGAAGDSIVFTAPDTATGWGGMRFDSTSEANDSSLLSYCRLQYGAATTGGDWKDVCGGGLFVYGFSKLRVSNTTVTRNRASGINSAGSGIFCGRGSPVLTDVVVSGNRGCWDGGGIHCRQSSMRMTNVRVTRNSADYGGGMYLLNATPVMENVAVDSNTAAQGGGIICDTSSPVITGGSISWNQAPGGGNYGGGLYLSGASAPRLTNVVISHNSSNAGGGMISYNSSPVLRNVLFAYNSGYRYGGGMYLSNTNAELVNVTVSNNTCYGPTSYGGAIYCARSPVTLTNCVLWYNRSQLGGSNPLYLVDTFSVATIRYCDVQGGKDSIHGGGGDSNYVGIYENCIDTNPLFLDTLGGIFWLGDSSACIDAGTPDTSGLGLPLVDLAGNLRIRSGRIDMGAYEYQAGAGVRRTAPDGMRNAGAILRVHPNPFRGITSIAFTVPPSAAEGSSLSLLILNTRGQTVRTLPVTGSSDRTRHAVIWDGTGDAGRAVASGTYFCSLTVGDEVRTAQRVELVR